MMRTLLIGATLLAACGNVEDKVVADAATSDGTAVDSSAIDAPPDAGVQAFEVVYGDDWRIAVDATNDGWFLLVANGNSDPDLATIQVVSVSDTHPIAIVRIVANPLVGLMTHGKAAGKIFVDNQTVYQAAIPEPRERASDSLLSLNLLDAPTGDYMFDAHVELKVNNTPFALDFKLHHVDSPITYFSPETAKRLVVRH
jgi:hypothetical protein